MRIASIDSPGKISIQDIDSPHQEEGEVLVRVKSIGLCGTDLATYRGINPMVDYPRIPGHEIAGVVSETRGAVPDWIKTDMQVTVVPYTSCGDCTACGSGRINGCRYNETMGVQRDGAAVEFITVPHAKIIPVNELSLDQTVCIEPLCVGWHAGERARITADDTVLVFGCGVVGLGAVLSSSYRNASVIAVDIDDQKLILAQTLGAGHSINSAQEDVTDRVKKITDGNGPSVVVEAAGLSQTFRSAVDLVCYAGRVVYIGYAKEPVTYDTRFIVSKELDILGSRNSLKSDFMDVVRMLSSGFVDISPLITHHYPLKEMETALKFWDENPDKVTKIVITV